MIGLDRIGDILKQDGLTGAWRRDDQGTLALADRRDQIDDAHVDIVLGRFHNETIFGVQRREILEGDQVVEFFRRLAIDCINTEQREISL